MLREGIILLLVRVRNSGRDIRKTILNFQNMSFNIIGMKAMNIEVFVRVAPAFTVLNNNPNFIWHYYSTPGKGYLIRR